MGKIRNLALNEYYHICCRIIGGEPLFKDSYLADRFFITLALANSQAPGDVFEIIRNARKNKKIAIKWALEFITFYPTLVDVLNVTLLDNHYHFLLKNLDKEENISKFMQRFNTAITMFTNNFFNRKGHLFQNTFKCIHIENNIQLLHTSLYIFLNILDKFDISWHEGKLKNWKEAKDFMLCYPYSNFAEFIGKRNKNFISGHEIIKDQFNTDEGYIEFLRSWACGNLNYIFDKSIIIEP